MSDQIIIDAYRTGYRDALTKVQAELDARLELWALDVSDFYTLLEDVVEGAEQALPPA